MKAVTTLPLTSQRINELGARQKRMDCSQDAD
jgi:hypothetical protein